MDIGILRRPYILIKDSRDNSWVLLLTCRMAGAFEIYGTDVKTGELVSPSDVYFLRNMYQCDLFVIYETEIFCLHGCLTSTITFDAQEYIYEIAYPRGSHVYVSDSMYETVVDTCNLLLKIKGIVT